MSYHQPRKVFPVIHHLDTKTSIQQAELVFSLGADGVFLISHDGRNHDLDLPACEIKRRYSQKLVGMNLLGVSAIEALDIVKKHNLDMVWADDVGVSSTGYDGTGVALSDLLKSGQNTLVFGSVAFKYQRHEPDPGMAAKFCSMAGMLPTTSGDGTGIPPTIEKAKTMSHAVAGGDLAIASGMTPENVHDYLPFFTHYLVATGISFGMHHFDPEKTKAFIDTVHAY